MLQAWKLDHPRISFSLYCVGMLLFLACVLFSLRSVLLLHEFGLNGLFSAFPAVLVSLLLLLVRPRRQGSSHGTAHWATLAELKRANLIAGALSGQRPAPQPLLEGPGGKTGQKRQTAPESLLPVGFRDRYPIVLTERQQESHVLIVAPTGKRKSSGLFIPALFAERGHRSIIINDLKDELFELTAGAVSRYHKVQLFSPTHPERSNGYNPLAHIKTSKQARDFALSWVENTGLSREEFYNNASRVLITAVTLHLVDTETRPALARLADLLSSHTLESMKTLLLTSQSDRARRTAGVFLETLQANPKVAGGIMLGVSNRFSFLVDSQDYRSVTSRNDLDFADLIDGQRPTAIYIQVPASAIEDLKPLTSVLVMQLMNFLTRRAEQERGGRLPRPIALYLDEFANMGKIPNIEMHITLIRGAGIATIAAVQDFGQLQRVYGREIAETLLSNFTTQITLPGVGKAEAEYYSHKLGHFTVLSTSTSTSQSGAGLFGARNVKTTRIVSEAQRSLLLPDEIRTMPIGSFVMISDNVPPIRGQFRTYIEQPELLKLTQLKVRRRMVSVEEEKGRRAEGQPQRRLAAGPAVMPPPEPPL